MLVWQHRDLKGFSCLLRLVCQRSRASSQLKLQTVLDQLIIRMIVVKCQCCCLTCAPYSFFLGKKVGRWRSVLAFTVCSEILMCHMSLVVCHLFHYFSVTKAFNKKWTKPSLHVGYETNSATLNLWNMFLNPQLVVVVCGSFFFLFAPFRHFNQGGTVDDKHIMWLGIIYSKGIIIIITQIVKRIAFYVNISNN